MARRKTLPESLRASSRLLSDCQACVWNCSETGAALRWLDGSRFRFAPGTIMKEV